MRIVLADDYPLIRTILKEYFLLHYPQVEIVGEAQTGQEAIELARQLTPDFIIMDIKMPIMDGITATGKITKVSPNTNIICYTGFRHELLEQKALAAGASGFFLKPFDLQEIAEKIMEIYNNKTTGYKVD